MRYFIKTFGCQANHADSERIAAMYQARGYTEAPSYDDADVVVINTCIVRQSAEDRVYGLVKNLAPKKDTNSHFKIVVTGCLVGAANREPSGQRLKDLRRILPEVDEFLPIEEVGFSALGGPALGGEHPSVPLRRDKQRALVPITNGCNNMCTFCIVPFSRGQEISRPFAEIIHEVEHLALQGYSAVTLLGQNVNSYGADLVRQGETSVELTDGVIVEPVMVKHLGRRRIPTLFPHLLDRVARVVGIAKISFISSNPWDFSDELIATIARHENINREIHLPVQSGDNEVLKRMNRWYTREEYLDLIKKIKRRIHGAEFTTDIIVGFPGETVEQFERSVDLCRQIGFNVAYISQYSPRKGTLGASKLSDDVPIAEKQRRFHRLDTLVNSREARAGNRVINGSARREI